MATRTIEGTIDTFSVDTGSEVTYLGATSSGNGGEAVRAFRVNPGGTGNIIIKLDKPITSHQNNHDNTRKFEHEKKYFQSSKLHYAGHILIINSLCIFVCVCVY